MKRISLVLTAYLLLGSVATSVLAAAQESSTEPLGRPENAGWMKRHALLNERVKQKDVELIFIGDSITQGWETKGKAVWDKYYGRRKAVNLGISGDRTCHVLWRMDHGNLDGIKPKVAVVMIGTNNTSIKGITPQEIAAGVKKIVEQIRTKLPETKILLLAIFPRRPKPNREIPVMPDPKGAMIAEASKLFSSVADDQHVYFLDIGQKFLKPDGTLPKEVMPDGLHPNEKGYEIWAEAMEPKLSELLGEKK